MSQKVQQFGVKIDHLSSDDHIWGEHHTHHDTLLEEKPCHHASEWPLMSQLVLEFLQHFAF